MVHIDMNKPDRELTPAVDLWEIVECVATRSAKGDEMLSVKFARVENTSDHMYDNVMLEGNGWGIGKQKLAALVGPTFAGDLDPLSLVGQRYWVETAVREYQGKSSLSVNIEGLKPAGLQRADDPPPGKTAPQPVPEHDDTPF